VQSSISEQSVILADTQQISSNLPDGDMVILNLKDGVYFGLNAVGARIWSLIQNPITVREILDILLAEYDVDRRQCQSDLLQLLRDLAKHGLVKVQITQQIVV